ncbi:hypothetical protein ACEPAI_391 [Sanghuangporus weigelae]
MAPNTAASTSVLARAHPSPPIPPEPAHIAITFQKTQRRYAQRPISQFPWKDFHLKMTSQGYVVGSDWAMTTFDERTDDQFFDSKRLQTIDEGTEVRYFFPYDPLNYSSGLDELNIVDEVRRLDLHRKESWMVRTFNKIKDYIAHVGRRFQEDCNRLFLCI